MRAERVVAVVVTYKPDAEVLENLSLLKLQIEDVIVVDNGSGVEELERVRTAGAVLLENGQNLGIAVALNRGIRQGLAAGAEWVFLFDQDSAVTEGYVDAMMACFRASGERLAILVPRYLDRRTDGVLAAPRRVGQTGLEAATTSGSLMPAAVFKECGWFAEEMFIDGVDYEYSLRVRRRGYWIEECLGATLMHSPGTPSEHRLLGKVFQAANYSPIRRYYQERNKIWVTRRYWRDFGGFCLGQFWISAKDLLKIVLVEQEGGRKMRFFLKGVWDGLRERMGRLDEA